MCFEVVAKPSIWVPRGVNFQSSSWLWIIPSWFFECLLIFYWILDILMILGSSPACIQTTNSVFHLVQQLSAQSLQLLAAAFVTLLPWGVLSSACTLGSQLRISVNFILRSFSLWFPCFWRSSPNFTASLPESDYIQLSLKQHGN